MKQDLETIISVNELESSTLKKEG